MFAIIYAYLVGGGQSEIAIIPFRIGGEFNCLTKTNTKTKGAKMYSSTQMLTYYQVSRPRKIKVRVVKAHAHVPYLGSGNVIDTRKLQKKISFGATFFASSHDTQLTEYDKWQKLNRKLRKLLI